MKLNGFKLLNGATKANLQQKWVKSTTEQGTNYPWINTLITPVLKAGNSDGTETAEYYNHLSDFRTLTKSSGTYTAVEDTYEDVDAYNSTDPDAAIYCMENNPTWDTTTSQITNAKNGNTTGLIYQWQATLDKDASDKLAGENCFYGYNGKYYGKLEDLLKAYPGLYKDATGSTDNDKIAAVKKELSDAYQNTTDKQGKISEFRAKYNIKVYTDGIMYYTHYIKDQNYKQGESGQEETYYSVMRNTIYGLIVTKLLRIGTDIPGGWDPDKDPEDPVDPTNVYMVVQATANPWVVSNQEITLQ